LAELKGFLEGVPKSSSSSSPSSGMCVVLVCVAERPYSSTALPFPPLPNPLPLVESLEPGVLEAAVLREEPGVEGIEVPERVKELAWDFILERRWVIAFGVTSGGEGGLIRVLVVGGLFGGYGRMESRGRDGV
jgi:hypothetical protein